MDDAIDLDRLRYVVSAELLALGLDASRPLRLERFTTLDKGDTVDVLTPAGRVLVSVPAWRLRRHSPDLLDAVLAPALETLRVNGDDLGLDDGQVLAPVDSDWLTLALPDDLELHVHRSAVVEGWPSDEPIPDAPPQTTTPAALLA